VLGEWVTKVLPQDEDEVPEGVEWDQLTPAQKAAYRARLDALGAWRKSPVLVFPGCY